MKQNQEQYKPLKNVRVIELSLMVAGASCTRMMADWGADVIKVENTKGGDKFRKWPMAIGAPADDDYDPIFDNLNANKRAISINTRSPEGKEVMYKLLESADAFVTNLRTEALVKSGLDYETLKEKFPKLVMTQLGGYGEKGPEAKNPGYDNTSFWARGGFLYSQGIYDSPDAYPVYMPMGFGDVTCAIAMMAGTVSAIYAARKTGKGDYVSMSLYGSATWLANILITGSEFGFTMPRSRKTQGNGFGLVCKCKDGKWFLPNCVDFKKDSQTLFKVMGFSDLVNNPVYMDRAKFNEPAEMQMLCRRMEETFAQKDSAEWKEIYEQNGLCYEILAGYDDVLTDEQAIANDYIYKMHYENGKDAWLVRTCLRSERMGMPEFNRGPMLGENTLEILRELGYSDDKATDLAASGVAYQHP